MSQRAIEYLKDGGHAYTPPNKTERACRICGQYQYAEIHQLSLKERLLRAVEEAITSEDGLDGLVGEKLLREAGYWPPQTGQRR